MTEQHPAALTLGDTVTVTITKTLPFGAFVKTADGTVGLVRDLQNGTAGIQPRGALLIVEPMSPPPRRA